jgi:hypothetical protein
MNTYLVTSITNKLTIDTDGIKVKMDLTAERERGQFNPQDPEHIVAWYADIVTMPQRYWKDSYVQGHVELEAQHKTFAMTTWEYDEHGDAVGNSTVYDVRVETTLNNRQAKNPKKWLLSVRMMDYKSGTSIKHDIEWPRLSTESLDFEGFKQGLIRRNIFEELRCS